MTYYRSNSIQRPPARAYYQNPENRPADTVYRNRVRYNRDSSYSKASLSHHRTRKAPSAKTIALFCGSALVVVLLVFAAFNTLPPLLALAREQQTGNSSKASDISTPVSEWEKGVAPHLYQTDQKWASLTYAGDLFGKSGCGPTCMSMVYVMLTGKTDKDPAAMAQFSESRNLASEEGTSWLFMSAGAEELGLMVTEVPYSESGIRENLVAGKPIICSMGPGDFTTTGHFIVLTGIDATGKVIVNDPNSVERSQKSWDFDTIISQCVNLWAYSV